MANWQVISLDTTTPQLRAPGTGDGYSFNSGSTQLGVWTTTGLGIGTASPAYRLHVVGATTSISAFRRTTADDTQILVGNTAGDLQIRALANGNGLIYSDTGKTLGFGSNGSGTAQLTLDTSGNLGLGVTPSAWGSIFKSIQLGNAFSYVAGRTDGVRQVWLGSNSYYNGTNWIYGLSQPAAQYYQNDGAHVWNTAPSGTAGNAISFTQAMTLDANANLQLNTTTNKVTQFGGSATGMTIGSATYPVLSLWDTGDASWNFCLAQDGGTAFLYNNANGPMAFYTNATERARIPAAGGMVVGTAALATNATDGFLYIPGCAGTPTGTPTALTGRVPLVVDTTNNKLYFYSGGAWRDAGP